MKEKYLDYDAIDKKLERKITRIENDHTLSTKNKKLILRYIRESQIGKTIKKGQKKIVGSGRIYTIHKTPQSSKIGFYDLVNKYSPEKLNPKFVHKVIGTYTVEHAIIDGIKIGDVRTLEATTHLFRHITNWKRLFDLAKKHDVTDQVYKLYKKARANFKTKTMPKRYEKSHISGTSSKKSQRYQKK